MSTQGSKKKSLSPYKIIYLIGSNKNKNSLKKSWKFKFNKEKENEYANKRKDFMKNFFRDQIEAQKKVQTNSSFNETNDDE